MRKWKAEIWMEDTPPEGESTLSSSFEGKEEHLSLSDINIAIEEAKAAIEDQWNGLKVVGFDVYLDKEIEQ